MGVDLILIAERVVITSGEHAREFVPVEAALYFVRNLCEDAASGGQWATKIVQGVLR